MLPFRNRIGQNLKLQSIMLSLYNGLAGKSETSCIKSTFSTGTLRDRPVTPLNSYFLLNNSMVYRYEKSKFCNKAKVTSLCFGCVLSVSWGHVQSIGVYCYCE